MTEHNHEQDMSNDDNSAIMHDTLAQYFTTVDGVMLVKWYMTAVVMDGQGRELLLMARSPGLAPWDCVGLLEYSTVATRGWIDQQTRQQ